MDANKAAELIAAGEGQRVEFKTSFGEARDGIVALCAMANADGGVVLFGVRDDGAIVGAQVGEKTLEDFSNQIKANTQPNLAPKIYQLRLDEKVVVAAVVESVPPGIVCYAYSTPYYRSGKTNQLMPPHIQRQKIWATFSPDVVSSHQAGPKGDEPWQEREEKRVEIYKRNRDLFLVHRWQPSSTPGQLADIQIELRQHNQGPLTEGTIKCVEYHLGPRFASRTIVQSNRDENFRLEVSAYGPFLCLARVRFDDGSDPVDLERYIDF
jgi:hypothetical protein